MRLRSQFDFFSSPQPHPLMQTGHIVASNKQILPLVQVNKYTKI